MQKGRKLSQLEEAAGNVHLSAVDLRALQRLSAGLFLCDGFSEKSAEVLIFVLLCAGCSFSLAIGWGLVSFPLFLVLHASLTCLQDSFLFIKFGIMLAVILTVCFL